jgi:hypothetical protein
MKDSFAEALERAEMLGHPPYDFPLLMSAPMVLALLREVRGESGGKRETRRFETPILRAAERAQAEGRALTAWVREGWQAWKDFDDKPPRNIPQDADVLYMADRPNSLWDSCRRAPFHMPRWASRLTLLDVTIRRERLGDISEEDARAEGVAWQDPTPEDLEWYRSYALEEGFDPEKHPMTGIWVVPGIKLKPPFQQICGPTAKLAYQFLWNHLHGPNAWETDKDREVMVIGFRPVLANIDGIGAEHDERH